MKKYVIANFKMNKVDSDITKYISVLSPLVADSDVDVILALPSVSIKTATSKLSKTNITVAGQNVSEFSFGSYTGEVSAEMLKGVGAKAVLIGHSERRTHFGESDEIVNKKLMSALKSGLISILCVGETIFDKTNGNTIKAIQQQLTKALQSIYANELKNIIIAYEPVWAIGTGVTPSNDEIHKATKAIRNVLGNMYDDEIASNVSIIYGGSVTDFNCKEISKITNINGVLVGASSLIPEKFGMIVNSFSGKRKK